jgi:hypothetical protein
VPLTQSVSLNDTVRMNNELENMKENSYDPVSSAIPAFSQKP